MPEREDIRAWKAAFAYAQALLSPVLENAIIEHGNGFSFVYSEGRMRVIAHPQRGNDLRREEVDLALDQIPGYIAALEAEQQQALRELASDPGSA